MSNDASWGATIAKHRLARRLGELRTASGYTANQVCDQLNWGRGKVGRFEANSWVRPEMSDVRDLLRIYDVSGAERDDLLETAKKARERPWWRDYNDIFDNEFPGFEGDAARICVYTSLLLPGLLQTPAYMEAQMRVGPRTSAWCNRAVRARLRRQEVLDRSAGSAPELVAVVTEASLRYRWGSVAEQRAQILHLVEMARLPNIELRLLRFDDGTHPGMLTAMNVFDYPGDEPSVVYLENDVVIQEVEKLADLKLYKATFSRLQEAALEPVGTMAALKQLAETLE